MKKFFKVRKVKKKNSLTQYLLIKEQMIYLKVSLPDLLLILLFKVINLFNLRPRSILWESSKVLNIFNGFLNV